VDTNRTTKDLQEQTDSFEKKKLHNIKAILRTFIEIEMSFQAKALELYTIAYQQVDSIDCESDLNVSNLFQFKSQH
jgi:protein FAM92